MGKKKVTDKCGLCGEERILQYSHVIPEFLYASTYNEKHQAVEVTSQLGEKDNLHQKGLREPLLCASCEEHLSKYETYAAPILKRIRRLDAERRGDHYIVQGVQYANFKLFQISLLWRASITSIDMFRGVKVGEHEEVLRQMLLDDDPGEADEYGCAMFVLENTRYLDKVIWAPVVDYIDGLPTYRFVTCNLFWYFFLPGAYPKDVEHLFV